MADDAQVLVIQHESSVGPGNLASWLNERDIPWQLVEARDARYPDRDDWRAIVVLGSEESAYDESLDWLRAEKEYLRPLVEAGVPMLGLCFGAQLLALLTGGEVHRAQQAIRGWTEVDADEDVLGGRWLAWHGDEIVPPPAATVLARSATCVEAFTVGPHLGLQFHPEVTEEIVEDWTADDFGTAELQPEADRVRAGNAENLGTATEGASRIYERFFAPVLTPAA
ncbi:type 1 glutamine amidotransferase [Naasia sp. SYSU D00057]|uniref:type 1 glutamine amidotransferase n=1 Tax=Naasia sp. SYSU D00057 TaxID=2817380 RepID=UPI001B3187CF|nr:type 1 glutamine amidotransferase [Naasia sp. SYSU D00057]